MTKEAVFADANVLLEALLQGRRSAELALQYLSENQIIVSPLTAHLFVYFGQKDGLALPILLELLARHKFTELSTDEIMWAIENIQDNDFEDALQVACAVTSGAKLLATFDRNLAERYQRFIGMKVLG